MTQKDLGALLRARSLRADDHDILISRNFVEAVSERPQGNVVYARDLPFGDFVRLSHVEEKKVRVVQPLHQLVAGYGRNRR
jgi:hypothetical protein